MTRKDASSIRIYLTGVITALVGLFWSPLGFAECGKWVAQPPPIEILNVAPGPNVSARLVQRLASKDSEAIRALPDLPKVLREAMKLSREMSAGVSVSLEYFNVDAVPQTGVRVSLDLPKDPNSLPIRRFSGEAPEGDEIEVKRFDIMVKNGEVMVTPGWDKGIKNARGVFIAGSTNHAWGLKIVDPPDKDIILNTFEMRPELYMEGARSEPLYREALAIAVRLANVIQPGDRIVLQSTRKKFELADGEWRPLPAPR